jgi:hypothetical protein
MSKIKFVDAVLFDQSLNITLPVATIRLDQQIFDFKEYNWPSNHSSNTVRSHIVQNGCGGGCYH